MSYLKVQSVAHGWIKHRDKQNKKKINHEICHI